MKHLIDQLRNINTEKLNKVQFYLIIQEMFFFTPLQSEMLKLCSYNDRLCGQTVSDLVLYA